MLKISNHCKILEGNIGFGWGAFELNGVTYYPIKPKDAPTPTIEKMDEFSARIATICDECLKDTKSTPYEVTFLGNGYLHLEDEKDKKDIDMETKFSLTPTIWKGKTDPTYKDIFESAIRDVWTLQKPTSTPSEVAKKEEFETQSDDPVWEGDSTISDSVKGALQRSLLPITNFRSWDCCNLHGLSVEEKRLFKNVKEASNGLKELSRECAKAQRETGEISYDHYDLKKSFKKALRRFNEAKLHVPEKTKEAMESKIKELFNGNPLLQNIVDEPLNIEPPVLDEEIPQMDAESSIYGAI